MSVSHPFLRELKGHASKLLNDSPKPVTDSEPALKDFCECFERILCKGLIPYETLVLILTPDCWHWLRNLGEEKCRVPYSYLSSVEDVLNNPRVETNRGKARLLIRTCLVKKCLHFPIQYLVNEDRCSLLYRKTSPLGDPILASVLTSLLLCLSTLSFSLDLDNAGFLDITWEMPRRTILTFVPAASLGLSIMFVEGKAIIIDILENSVAAENGDVEIGDIIDSVNGKIVDKKCQGSLTKMVRKMRSKPIDISFIKSRTEGRPYTPVIHYWQQAGLDPATLCTDFKTGEEEEESVHKKSDELSGVVYLGWTDTGGRGDLKEIHTAIQSLLPASSSLPPPPSVSIECGHLGLRVVDLQTGEVVTEHNYMEISACGSSQSSSPYFAFIAENKSSGQDKQFVCHVFRSSDSQIVSSFLDTIGMFWIYNFKDPQLSGTRLQEDPVHRIELKKLTIE